MVDAGGGAFVRFGEAGARIEDLRLLGISHFHPDHSSDLPAILWVSNNFRSEPLPLIGPSRDEVFPGAVDFVSRLFDGADGAFPILSGTVGGDHLGFPLVVTEVDTKDSQPSLVFDEEDLKVSALGVPHNAPALAFRVEVENVSVVFGSDQIGTNPNFPEFARDASLLVMHLTNSESSAPNPIHALPSVVGRVAREAEARRLVLSHLTSVEREHRRFETTSLADLPANLAVVREHYKGEIIVASDLLCIDLGGS
jgi:ribonuclease BN (tRNA processing enzyme)